MTPERIAELRALVEAATPSPWRAFGQNVDGKDTDPRFERYDVAETWVSRKPEADAAFIAAARTALPEALDEVERLRQTMALYCLKNCSGSCEFEPCVGPWITKATEAAQ